MKLLQPAVADNLRREAAEPRPTRSARAEFGPARWLGNRVLRVSAVHGGAGPRLVGAVDEITPAAEAAFVVLAAQKSEADPVARPPHRDTLTNRIDYPDDLVTGDDRLCRISALPLDGDSIGVANAASFDPQPHLPW